MRIFFASDLHGSDRCFRKFLNAAPFFEADVLVLGGDLTGKAIVPIVSLSNGRYLARLLSDKVAELDKEELPAFETQVRDSGFYPWVATQDEIDAVAADPIAMEALFSARMRESLRRWFDLAEQRLGTKGLRCFLIPGNDDMAVVDEVLADLPDSLINVSGRRSWVDDQIEIVGLDYVNPTPWASPREASETDLAAMLDATFAGLVPRKFIANVHCPPSNTALDQAQALTEDLKPITFGGQPMFKPVGSDAVRAALERSQPLLSLHGHIHESRGSSTVGGTLCLNPGSEYGEGILRGVIIDIDRGRVASHRFVTG